MLTKYSLNVVAQEFDQNSDVKLLASISDNLDMTWIQTTRVPVDKKQQSLPQNNLVLFVRKHNETLVQRNPLRRPLKASKVYSPIRTHCQSSLWNKILILRRIKIIEITCEDMTAKSFMSGYDLRGRDKMRSNDYLRLSELLDWIVNVTILLMERCDRIKSSQLHCAKYMRSLWFLLL